MTKTIAILVLTVCLMINNFKDSSLSERVNMLEIKVQELNK